MKDIAAIWAALGAGRAPSRPRLLAALAAVFMPAVLAVLVVVWFCRGGRVAGMVVGDLADHAASMASGRS